MDKEYLRKRLQTQKLAHRAGLIGFWGKPKDEYRRLMIKVTGKEKLSFMNPEEICRFIEVLKSLQKP